MPSHLGVDSIVIGFYQDKQLRYAARVRAGFVPLTRRQVFERIKPLQTAKCPFVNLPEKDAGRWGQGLTAEKMKECVWVKPRVVAEIEFLEWTGADHLRHTKFVGLRDDKDPRKVVRESLMLWMRTDGSDTSFTESRRISSTFVKPSTITICVQA